MVDRTLGHFRILEKIGAGGMGEVYRAADTRLDRIVALKVLPSHLSGRPDLRQRFEREARAISSLNHPHICTLYDIGQDDGSDFLVMEYLEGETLTARLRKGPLPPEQVLRYATEIADALDKAHRQGIIHRDLKPGNIMLVKSGTKLLDFGLAKLELTKPRGTIALDATVTGLPEEPKLTVEGSIMGTFQYMAPEQLEGKEADARTDVFAFGAIVYEMATGRPAFEGHSQASLIASIMDRDPTAISVVRPALPPALDRVVKTCLAKDPDDRFQTAHDVKLQLEWIAEGGSLAGVPVPVAAARKSRERLAWIIAALFCLSTAAVAVGLFHFTGRARIAGRTVRSFILPPEDAVIPPMGTPAVSPDGTRIVMVTRGADGKSALWIRPLDVLAAQRLSGTEGAYFPFWSPNGQSIGFFADGKLKRVDLAGGAVQTLCDAPESRGGTWSRDNIIVFALANAAPLQRISATGAGLAAVSQLNTAQREWSHRWPYFLPDGKHFLYLALGYGGSENIGIYVGSLDSRQPQLLLRENSNPVYAPPGYLLFLREKVLMAQPFDAGSRKITGDAFVLAEGVRVVDWQTNSFSVSESGVLTYVLSGGEGAAHGAWLDRNGQRVAQVAPSAGTPFAPRLSPDGRKAAGLLWNVKNGNNEIWVHDFVRGVNSPLTPDPAFHGYPVWSPDGNRIVFSSNPRGRYDLYRKSASGAGSEELLLESERNKFAMDWSSDGRFLLYVQESRVKSGWALYLLSLSDSKTMPFQKSEFGETWGRFSPDGRWVAYTSAESGRNEVYVAPFPGAGARWQISTAGGSEPKWRRDGREIFYLDPNNQLTAVIVRGAGARFEVAGAKTLFQTRPTKLGRMVDVYEPSTDGQRFLVNTGEEGSTAPFALVLNWAAR